MAEIIRLGVEAAERRQPIADTVRDIIRVELSALPDRDDIRGIVTDAVADAIDRRTR